MINLGFSGSAKGEIAELVSYVKPDMAIITNVYPMHIEFFENFEGIAEAKAEIFTGLKKGGYALINADTNFSALLQKRAEEQGAKVVTFGKADLKDFHFETAQEGEHYVSNALCALKVVQLLGLDVHKAEGYVKDFGALDGRGREWKLHFAGGYNAEHVYCRLFFLLPAGSRKKQFQNRNIHSDRVLSGICLVFQN